MSETGFRIFNRVFSIGAALLYAGLLTAFFARLDRKSTRLNSSHMA